MNAVELPEDQLMCERDAARYLAVSRSFLANARCFGTRENGADGPPWVRVGKGGVRYSLADLRQYVAARRNLAKPFPAGV